MDTMLIEILKPKARKLVNDLADMDIIAIKEPKDDGFISIINKIRAKAKNNPPSLDEITKEVELVRTKRYVLSNKHTSYSNSNSLL
jgi:hypothetical protein